MFFKHLKIGFRNFRKNKITSTINLLGLSLAVGCCLVTFTFLDWAFHLDQFHEKLDNIVIMERVSDLKNNSRIYGTTPESLGPTLANDFSQVINFARLTNERGIFKKEENVFRENISFVDRSFFDIFDFPIKWGNEEHFDNNNIILTEELSTKLFGSANSINQTVTIRFVNEGQEYFEKFVVSAVLEKKPKAASFYFSCLIPYSKRNSIGWQEEQNWGKEVAMTFLELDDMESLNQIIPNTQEYVNAYNQANLNDPIDHFLFQPLKNINMHAYKVYNSRFYTSHVAAYFLIFGISLSIILLVCFNYMNITLASASSRLKEIGVRKILGSNKKQIIYQFLLENIFICFLGIIIGLFLAYTLFIPWFSKLGNLDFTQELLVNTRMYLTLLGLLIFLVIGGSLYPILSVVSIKPLSLMKNLKFYSGKNLFSKILISFQFLLTILAIIISITLKSEYIKAVKIPWKYDPQNIVVVKMDENTDYSLFKNQVLNLPNIEMVEGSVEALGSFQKQILVDAEGEKSNYMSLQVTPGFFKLNGITLDKGEDPSLLKINEGQHFAIVNQQYTFEKGWETSIGKTLKIEEIEYQIISESQNFRYESPDIPIAPIVMTLIDDSSPRRMMIKIKPTGKIQNLQEPIEKLWLASYPTIPFEYYYQDQVFDNFYNGYDQVNKILIATSFITMIIAIMGLFGLALLVMAKKMKEISIKKVLGAPNSAILYFLNKDFVIALIISSLIGLPLGFMISSNLAHQLNPDSSVSKWVFALTLGFVIALLLISVAYHSIKAIKSNPIIYLRDE